ncbi:MAG: YfhO family protein, partial [Acetatifactor sp.]|nr:YfhO family protein [Acetatifactor sp.]
MKNVKIRRESAFLLLAFLLPMAVMLCLFIINGIYPFGCRSFLSGDQYNQYMTFLSEILHKVRGGQGLDFSF